MGTLGFMDRDRMHKARKRLHEIIEKGKIGDTGSRLFDLFIITLICLNISSVYIETLNLPDSFRVFLKYFETVSVIIFTIEYLLRIYTAPEIYPELNSTVARVKYVFSFMALIDLVAILPWYLPFFVNLDLRVLRALRLMRLFRILKINRYIFAFENIMGVIKSKSSELLSSIFIVFILMMVSSILMYNVENKVQPDVFDNAFSGFWWAVATFTTVGYGDIYPVTVLGKIIGAFIAILGIGFVAVPTGIISSGFMEQVKSIEPMGDKDLYETGSAAEFASEPTADPFDRGGEHVCLETNPGDPLFKMYRYCPCCGRKMPSR